MAVLIRLGKFLLAALVIISLATAAMLAYARWQGLTVLSVQTGSMRPAIRPGDAVLVQSDFGRPEPGKVYTYRRADNPQITLTHRFVGYDAGYRMIFKGDASARPDPLVGPEQLVGQVVHRVPLLGWSFNFLRSLLGLALLVYIPALALATGEVRRLMRHFAGRYYRLHAYPW